MKLLCLILDTVYDDYQTIWEMLSVVENNYTSISADELMDEFTYAMNELLRDGYIETYRGTSFKGEELLVLHFIISKEFITNHRNDWKTKEFNEEDIRFFITKKGEEYYSKNCSTNN